MYLKRFGLPSYGDEKGYLANCGVADMTTPFETFPQRNLGHIDFSDITVFSGNSDSEKNLAFEIIAEKLGIDSLNVGLDRSIVRGYLGMCYTRYSECVENPGEIEKIFISSRDIFDHLEKNKYRFDGNSTLLHFYESKIRRSSICFLQCPEAYMSLEEIISLARLIEDFATYSKTQFIISSNSPAILAIKDALIYDFNDRVIMGRTWCSCAEAERHISFYRDIIDKHKNNVK